MRLYVGNLPFQTTEFDVRDFFERAGFAIDTITLMRDRITSEPRGFGFVEISDPATAERAIETCNGKNFLGRAIVVNEARALAPGSGKRRR
jgi:cold-inducible RNA-binding protein